MIFAPRLMNAQGLAASLSNRRSASGWLGFLDTYPTLCLDPPQEIRMIFEEVRAAEWLECVRPHAGDCSGGGKLAFPQLD
jgi:hypothetical protein